tara:strand:- start:689 stop:1222 length:534 start_codon:yes stop_codon:yes gene_type:complete
MKKTPEQKIKEYFKMDCTQSFEKRAKTTPAEDEMQIYYENRKGIKVMRYGPDQREPSNQFGVRYWMKIKKVIRKTPDYIVMDLKKPNAYFLEVKGCGKDGLVKLKKEDLEEYKEWAKEMPFSFFVFNMYKREVIQFSIQSLAKTINTNNIEMERFELDNKLHFPVPYKLLKKVNELK